MAVDGAAGSVEELERIRPDLAELAGGLDRIRADSGFCRDDLLRWCEDHHVDYVMGLANNDRLKSESAEAMTQAEAEFNATARRGCSRISATGLATVGPRSDASSARPSSWRKAPIPDSIVTSLSPERLGARALYEDFYCARGDMENA